MKCTTLGLSLHIIWWKTTFDERRTKDNRWRKTIFNRRRPLTADYLWRKTTFEMHNVGTVPTYKKTFDGRWTLIRCIVYYLKKCFTTPHLDSHSTTDPKPDIQSAVQTGNRISHDGRNVFGIMHLHAWRKDNIFREIQLNHSEVRGERLWDLEPWCQTLFLLRCTLRFAAFLVYNIDLPKYQFTKIFTSYFLKNAAKRSVQQSRNKVWHHGSKSHNLSPLTPLWLSQIFLKMSSFLHACTCIMPRTFLASREILFPV